jgi:hypothetical protein
MWWPTFADLEHCVRAPLPSQLTRRELRQLFGRQIFRRGVDRFGW